MGLSKKGSSNRRSGDNGRAIRGAGFKRQFVHLGLRIVFGLPVVDRGLREGTTHVEYLALKPWSAACPLLTPTLPRPSS